MSLGLPIANLALTKTGSASFPPAPSGTAGQLIWTFPLLTKAS